MIYVENDFYSNFQGMVNSDDESSLEKIFIDQISHIVAKQRGDILSLFQKSGVTVSDNPSNEEICNLITQNLKSNVKLRAGISYLISKNNDLLAVEKKNNRKKSDSKKDSSDIKKIDWEQSADTVTYIATSLANLSDSLKGNRLNNFQKELKKQSNAKAPNYSSKSYSSAEGETTPPKKSNRWKWILAGVVIAGGIYYAYKKGYIGKKGDSPSIEPPVIE